MSDIAITEASKLAKRNWDSANLTILGCRVKKDKAERFKKECKRRGTTPNAVFLEIVDKFLEESPEN